MMSKELSIQEKINKKKYFILKQVWWYDWFRWKQEELIDSILWMNDSFWQFPTGMWKSICFQLPSLMFNWTTIVISPFVALMKDQVLDLEDTCIWKYSWYLNSTLEQQEKFEMFQKIKNWELKILYISPERFVMDSFLNVLSEIPISMIVVDEAHLVYQSEDFRPEFWQIWKAIKKLKNMNKMNFPDRKWKIIISALTATANENIRNHIIESLWMENPKVIIMDYIRHNLLYYSKFCETDKEKRQKFLKLCLSLKNVKWVKLVYWITQKEVQELSKALEMQWLKSDYYHAWMSDKKKESVHKKFLTNKLDFLCCTLAFWTWINKKDIRIVINYWITFDILEYAQQSWRAWRDWLDAWCILLFSNKDIWTKKFMIWRDYEKLQNLNEMIEFWKENENDWKSHASFLMDYFC